MNLFEKVAAAFGAKKTPEQKAAAEEKALDAVTLDNARARRRFERRRKLAIARRTKRVRRAGRTAKQHAEFIATGQVAVLNGEGVRGPFPVSDSLRANVARSIRNQMRLDARDELLREGRSPLDPDFADRLDARVKVLISETGLPL